MPRKAPSKEIEAKEKTEQEELEARILATLAELGGQRIKDESVKRQGKTLILPETMTLPDAVEYLQNRIEQDETETEFSRTFKYRPFDGAHALHSALIKVYGSSGIGQRWGFFGMNPPAMQTINIGVNETTQVPWGAVSVPMFEGIMMLGASKSKDYGLLFQLSVTAPRKYQAHVEGLFRVIEDELESNSIYRGKAIDGAGDPDYLDLTGIDRQQVIYSDEVLTQLEANVWSVLRHTLQLRALDIKRKRAVLLEGPYGTGKTLAAFLTAQEAINNGWTFIYCRPGKDNLHTVMQTARLYQPAVVFFEDVDALTEGSGAAENSQAVGKLLDVFDGITAKNTEILVVLTTNHRERIHRAMVRPGRLDAMIHIGALDKSGIMRMIHAVVPPDQLADELNEDDIYEAMEGYLPAFAAEAIGRAMRYSIARNDGVLDVLTTDDFVDSARGLRPQLELMQGAGEGQESESIGAAFQRTVEGVVKDTLANSKIHEIDSEHPVFEFQTAGNGGSDS